MQTVFVSYSSTHRDLTRELVAAIEAQYGVGSVWWDDALESRGPYAEQIRAALDAARVVVVIWTTGAMVSEYVYAEASRAHEQRKLVNVRPAGTSFRDIPEPFNIHHVDDADDHAGILATIANVMAGTPVATRVPLHELYFRQHGRRLIDPKRSALPRDLREASPAELLQAKFGVVEYVDATSSRSGLVDWCLAGERATAGRLIHGAGGLGKTRLLIETAATLRERGWMAGFLDRPDDRDDAALKQRRQALDQWIEHGDDPGLLIVIDYAEGRQDEVTKLAERLAARREGETRPIRLVLLARGAGEWWTALHDGSPEMQRIFRGAGGEPDVVALPSIATGQDRLALFDESLKAFAPTMQAQGYAAPSRAPSAGQRGRIGSGSGFARPLAIQMEALLWLASDVPKPGTGAVRVHDLLRRVLWLERRHWNKLLGILNDNATRDMVRGVAQVTAVQGAASHRDVEKLLMADGFYAGRRTARVDVDPVLCNLARVYGTTDGGLGALEPDLLGEHHVATVADVELVDGCLRWIEAQPEEAREKRRRDLVTVLQRATHPEHGAKAVGRATALLDHLIATQTPTLAAALVAVAVDTEGALADRMQRLVVALDGETLAALDAQLPIRSLALMDVSLKVAERRAELVQERLAAAEVETDRSDEEREAALADRAARIGTLGNRLSNSGRREKALAASQEAVDIRRRLAASRPDAFLPDLATSLNNTGAMLSNLGRREEALAASQEAVDIRRRLAVSRPDAFLPDLAQSISVMSDALAALDQSAEAAEAAHQALEILIPFVEHYPQAYGDLGLTIAADMQRYSEAAAQTPDVALLERLIRALGLGDPAPG